MEDFYEHIDDYKDGSLKGELLAQFETAMESDASLRLAVDNYASAKSISEGLLEVDMMETLNSLANGDLTSETDTIENRSPENNDRLPSETDQTSNSEVKTKTSIFNIRNLMAAASVIGVIFFAGWWVIQDPYSHLNKKEILASFVDPVNESATKSTDTVGMTLLEKGIHYYTLNRYKDSEKWLKLSLEKEKDKKLRSIGYYWLGAAHLRRWEVDEAAAAWEKSDEEETKKALQMISK